jgi:ABC-type Mn2+/Zn2+ transport system permease subunit
VVEVAREHHKGMLDVAKNRVCSVVNTDVADCLLVATLPCRPACLRKKNYEFVNAALSSLSDVDPLLCLSLSAHMARSKGDKVRRASSAFFGIASVSGFGVYRALGVVLHAAPALNA